MEMISKSVENWTIVVHDTIHSIRRAFWLQNLCHKESLIKLNEVSLGNIGYVSLARKNKGLSDSRLC